VRTLAEIREEIDEVDLELLRALRWRWKLVQEAVEVKAALNFPVQDRVRESAMVEAAGANPREVVLAYEAAFTSMRESARRSR
jgi:chorismate mutase